MRRRAVWSICLLLSSAYPGASQAQAARDSVLATVHEFFRTMTAKDSVGASRILLSDGRYYGLRQAGDSITRFSRTHEAYLTAIGQGTDQLVERMWEPIVLVHGPIAQVWAPYDFYLNGRFLHCGVDSFSLVRDQEGWKIAGVLFTMEPTGCAPSPLGPPQDP